MFRCLCLLLFSVLSRVHARMHDILGMPPPPPPALAAAMQSSNDLGVGAVYCFLLDQYPLRSRSLLSPARSIEDVHIPFVPMGATCYEIFLFVIFVFICDCIFIYFSFL